MTPVIEERGFFWWQASAVADGDKAIQTSVAGILTIDDKGNIELRLDRPLPHPTLRVGFGTVLPDDQFLIGRLSDSDKVVLLMNIHAMNFAWGSYGVGSNRFSAGVCLQSDVEIDSNPEAFEEIRIELHGLEDWLGMASLTYEKGETDGNIVEGEVKYKRQSYEYKFEDAVLCIESVTSAPLNLLSNGPYAELHFKQSNWLSYKSRLALSCQSAKVVCTRLEEFFSILLGSYFRLEWPYLITRGVDSERWYKMYSYRGAAPEYKPDNSNTLTWFFFVRDTLGELFSSWHKNREHFGPGYYLYIAGLRKADLYAEHRFVNLIWALESLHRKQANEDDSAQPSERVRRILSKFQSVEEKKDLQWLKGKLKYAEDPTLENRIFESFENLPIGLDLRALRKFARRCAQRRNEISHTGGPGDGETFSAFHEDISKLLEALAFLYHAHLLKELGLGDDWILKAFRDSFVAKSRILPAFEAFSLLGLPNSTGEESALQS